MLRKIEIAIVVLMAAALGLYARCAKAQTAPVVTTVIGGTTVTTNGSKTISNLPRAVYLEYNVTGTVSGATPTLTFTVTNVDPQNPNTTGTSVSTSSITSASNNISSPLLLAPVPTGVVVVSWAVTGAGASFGGTYVTLSSTGAYPTTGSGSGNGTTYILGGDGGILVQVNGDGGVLPVAVMNQPTVPTFNTPYNHWTPDYCCCGTTDTTCPAYPSGTTSIAECNTGPNVVYIGVSGVSPLLGLPIQPNQCVGDTPDAGFVQHCIALVAQTDGGCLNRAETGP